MEKERKYAVFDTDFVSKSNIVQINSQHTLANLVLEFTDYNFCCHEMLITELNRNGKRSSQAWLKNSIASKKTIKFTDFDILTELESVVGSQCFRFYLQFLKEGCDIFEKDYFKMNYSILESLLDTNIDKETFLNILQSCDNMIGFHQSSGEKKAFVLIRTLSFLKGNTIFLFCSDDSKARIGFANSGNIPCLSIIAVFLKLKLIGYSKEVTFPYFNSFYQWRISQKNPQPNIKVWEFTHGTTRKCSMDLIDVFNGIYNDEFLLLRNGDLFLKSSNILDTCL